MAMRILIVAPQSAFFPIGLASIAAVWKKAGHQVEAVNLSLAPDWAARKGEYDFVATGGLACHFAAVREILAQARAAGIPTIVGGGLVTSEPELMASTLPADYFVLGEGEDTAVELLDALASGRDPAVVPGLAFFRDGALVITGPRKAVMDLDRLPLPDLDSLGFDAYLDRIKPSDIYNLDIYDHPRSYYLLGSRSCPYNCTFCYHPLGKKYRQRSLDSIFAELALAVPRYRINIVEILDELFAGKPDRVLEFCRRFRELAAGVPWEVRWGCQLRVDRLSDQLLAALKDSGCYIISYGFESYSATVLKSMKKHISPEQIHRAVHLTLAHGISIQGNFIFGDKAETGETAEETFRFWREHAEAGIALGFIQPYPDSDIYRHCLEKGLIPDRLDFIAHHLYDRINMTSMSDRAFFMLRVRMAMHFLLYSPHAVPRRVEPDRLVVACPHCGKVNDYGNYRTYQGSRERLFFNRMLHCRHCRRRFWGRSRLFQAQVAAIRLLLAPGIRWVFSNALFIGKKLLDPVLRRNPHDQA